jgi:hypothetical protein
MEVIRILGTSSPSANTFSLLYTVGEDKGAVISMLNICNRDSYDATIRIAIYRDNELPEAYETESPSNANYLEYGMLIYGNCSAQRLKGVTLAQGDKIGIWASSENISFNLFGSTFDQTFEYV